MIATCNDGSSAYVVCRATLFNLLKKEQNSHQSLIYIQNVKLETNLYTTQGTV